MKNELKAMSTCLWNYGNICIWDISVPGKQVTCFPCGCREYEQKISVTDYAKGEKK